MHHFRKIVIFRKFIKGSSWGIEIDLQFFGFRQKESAIKLLSIVENSEAN